MSVGWFDRLPVDLIKEKADEHSLDYRLIAAIIKKESGGEQWITRFEALQKAEVTSDFWQFASKLHITPITEQMHQITSWGYAQVMGYTARRLGYQGYIPALCDPETNIHYQCLLLKQLFNRFKVLQDVISAYNQGTPRKGKDGLPLNYEAYVMPILNFMSELNDS